MTTVDAPVPGPVTYALDSKHSSAYFSIRHFMIAHVRGQFAALTGTLTHDPQNPQNSAVEITIDANSIQTGDPDRDAHLKTPDFLDTAQFSTIGFRSKSVTVLSDDKSQVVGDFTMRGVTKEVTLEVTGSTNEVKDVWGNWRIGFTGRTQIKRSDYGLHWNAPLETGGFVLSDEVDVTLDVQFIKQT